MAAQHRAVAAQADIPAQTGVRSLARVEPEAVAVLALIPPVLVPVVKEK